MSPEYSFKDVEKKVQKQWEESGCFKYEKTSESKPFSMFLIPPNASGPIHVGNALMVAIQDILARHYRAKGTDTLWVPGFDHGGYETQVTFERSLEERGIFTSREEYPSKQLFNRIEDFVEGNKTAITRQIKSLGASVDWSRLRYTLDEESLHSTNKMFGKLVEDTLISRKSYMMNYCTACATVLADIELKKERVDSPLYSVKFSYADEPGALTLKTTNPEYLFSVTHVLVHAEDERYVHFIGKDLINPLTGKRVSVIGSKRKVSWHKEQEHLTPFCPSFVHFDYEYALRNGLPTASYLDWEGLLTERYPGASLQEARDKDLHYLELVGCLESEEVNHSAEISKCKKGHQVNSIIRLTWFLNFDNNHKPVRQETLSALQKEKINIYPAWRKKGLVDWISKMHDWPISRQNVWGIRMPVWYEVEDAAKFLVWFFDHAGKRQHGNLKKFLDAGTSLEEVVSGLQRVYALEDCNWTLKPDPEKTYLPETDTFDTWFSSGSWSVSVYESLEGINFDDVYPSDTVIIGYDLLRLSIARKIMLGVYLTGKIPFGRIYFHPLLKAEDGQKMSKSLGNSVSVDYYLDTYGADVTRMALVSYLGSQDDFVFETGKLEFFKNFVQSVWRLGRVYEVLAEHGAGGTSEKPNTVDNDLLDKISRVNRSVSNDIEKHFFTRAQDAVVLLQGELEKCANRILEGDELSAPSAFKKAFTSYLNLLHPFAPHVTEEIYSSLKIGDDSTALLATKFRF